MTWTCPECRGSMPVLAVENDEVFVCPWCRNELAVYPEELDSYSDFMTPLRITRRDDEDREESPLKRLFK